MAKMFYNVEEASSKLGTTEDGLKEMVRAGKLREFRDADSFNYKVEEVDKIALELAPVSSASSASASGEIVLEPVDDSSIELVPSGSDIIPLDASDFSDTSSGTIGGSVAADNSKSGTVVPSVGVSIFDDEDLDEHVDPLAQTAVSDVGGLGLEGIGSGSGILDLTRESDDTSLGKELLDEIYTDDDSSVVDSPESGESTHTSLEIDNEEEGAELVETTTITKTSDGPTVHQVVEYGPDAASSGLSALMVVALIVLLFGGLAAASLIRGMTPSLLEVVYAKLWMFVAGVVVFAGLAAGITFAIAKKKSG